MLNDKLLSWSLSQVATALNEDDGIAFLLFGALFLSCLDTKLKQ